MRFDFNEFSKVYQDNALSLYGKRMLLNIKERLSSLVWVSVEIVQNVKEKAELKPTI